MRLRDILTHLQDEESLCIPCNAEEHLLCWNPIDDMCCCVANKNHVDNVVETVVKSEKGGYQKNPADITDVTSTGRKRAAVLYPIAEGMLCEWAQLGRAGGGVIPIIGCMGNKATDIHHGPDKNTLNNKPENVHRICATCHNRFHEANDKFYGTRPPGTEPFIPLDGYEWGPHDPNTKATIEELKRASAGEWKSSEVSHARA